MANNININPNDLHPNPNDPLAAYDEALKGLTKPIQISDIEGLQAAIDNIIARLISAGG